MKHTRAAKLLDCTRAAALVADQLRPPFRGQIWEFYANSPMARGYANDGRPFDIDTANYLRPVLHDIRTRPHGKFVLKAAVQTLKTLTLEMSAGYFVANAPGDMVLYFTGDEDAFDQGKTRSLPFIKSNEVIGQIVDEVMAASASGRFNITTSVIYLPNMTLRLWPLNLTSTQRISLRYVFISDAFLSGRTGFIGQAIARTKQHNTNKLKDYKIIIESQGGEDGDDFDAEWKETDQRMLNVVCPHCASGIQFDWHHERGDDFVPTPPLIIPSLDHAAWIEENRKLLLTPERRHAGMKRGDDALVKKADGAYDEREVLKATYYECPRCGSEWRDDPQTRLALDRSSHYVSTNPTALPENIGFSWPDWAGQRIEWGKTMLKYLQAKQASASGNIEPLKQWHQKSAAKSWSKNLEKPSIEIAPGSYDPNQIIENEHSRNMAVDCQQQQEIMDATGKSVVGYFWYIVRVVDQMGNSKQLARGYAKSWEGWIAVQRKWKVPNDRVVIDLAHWGDQVMLRAAAEHETIQVEKPLPPFFIKERLVTWLLLLGSDETRFGKHKDGKTRTWSEPQSIPVAVFDSAGKRKVITLKKVRWSNFAFKSQLEAIRSGAPGMPKMESLGREHLDELSREMETGMRTYEKQMNSQTLTTFRGKDKYEALRPDDHYFDCEGMLLVRQAIDGLLGHLAVAEAA